MLAPVLLSVTKALCALKVPLGLVGNMRGGSILGGDRIIADLAQQKGKKYWHLPFIVCRRNFLFNCSTAEIMGGLSL